MSNPRKKKKNSRRRTANPSTAITVSRRRKNPMFKKFRRSRRSNPGTKFLGMEPVALLTLGVGAAAGAVGSRAVPQLILKDKNTGLMGYAANAVAAVGLGFVAGKFNPDLATGVIAGGFGSLFQRVWNERVSKTSPSADIQGLGDYDYSEDGMGRYVNATWPAPTITGDAGYVATAALPAGAAPAAAAAIVASPRPARLAPRR